MKLSNKRLEKLIERKDSFINLFILGFFLLIFATTTYAYIFNYWYQGRIFPGIYIDSIYVGGKTPGEAYQLLNEKFYQFEQKGFTYIFKDKVIKINAVIISPTDPDLVYEIIEPQTDTTVKRALLIGRKGAWWKKIYNPITTAIFKKKIDFSYSLEKDRLIKNLKNNLEQYEQIPKNAQIIWSKDKFNFKKEQNGKIFQYENIIKATEEKIKKLDSSPLTISLSISKPTVNLTNIQKTTKDNLKIISEKKPTLIWQTSQKNYKKSFLTYKNHIILNKNSKGEIILELDKDWLTEELKKIKKEIDTPSQNAKFEIIDGRVKEFQQSKDGKFLNINKNISLINTNFSKNKFITGLELDIDRAKIQTADVNNLGISEIIGVGVSDFSGSPPNRIHNIKIGAQSLNGLLIKPGEEFSLLKALLPIDQSNGYLPELVIKGNETVPEYGGGLCQIGTTAFRAALASGLPITQRQNHSYRVRYYEPAGTDATIYDPAPDFRFLNDTPGHILIQTKMENNKLIFEYWGTEDGRQATSTKPRIYNITPPPPTKFIETLTLKPGEIKCTERAHNGADAEFTYIVIFPDGEKKEKIFKSHYRPWQEVCLKGVEKLSTSTPDIIKNQ